MIECASFVFLILVLYFLIQLFKGVIPGSIYFDTWFLGLIAKLPPLKKIVNRNERSWGPQRFSFQLLILELVFMFKMFVFSLSC